MKINYNRYKELNQESILDDGVTQAACFYVVSTGVERFLLGETLTEEHKNLLVELNVIELTETEKSIVGPFKFNTDGFKETN